MLDYAFMEKALPFLLKAIPVTLGLTFLVLVLSFLPAIFLADRRIRGRGWGEKLITLYISFIRGTPLVLQILLLYALLPSLLHSLVQMAGLSFDVFHGVNPLWYAVIVFTLNTIALMSEIFRSAITSVADGQMEAGLTIGLSRWQTYREVIIPQALSSAVPNLCNLTVNLIKGTSLAFFIGVKDIMAMAKIQAAYGYNYIEAYLEVFILYLVICSVVQVIYKLFEIKINWYCSCQQKLDTKLKKLGIKIEYLYKTQ